MSGAVDLLTAIVQMSSLLRPLLPFVSAPTPARLILQAERHSALFVHGNKSRGAELSPSIKRHAHLFLARSLVWTCQRVSQLTAPTRPRLRNSSPVTVFTHELGDTLLTGRPLQYTHSTSVKNTWNSADTPFHTDRADFIRTTSLFSENASVMNTPIVTTTKLPLLVCFALPFCNNVTYVTS